MPAVLLGDVVNIDRGADASVAQSAWWHLESGRNKADLFHVATVSDFGMIRGRYADLV